MGPPTDPGPSGTARVSKRSVHPCQATPFIQSYARERFLFFLYMIGYFW
ncbi:unnamed protein product [Staurois parvus]|uniref:Uncharacterized protein n=1 Tax=Staurois parvus TaxID=386267 RepID=A0ABN9BK35_9NEOB|nr:unnamed protein product [Staurois parvus]